MSKILALLTIIASSHGILSATRGVGTTAGQAMQRQYMTDPSSPSEYMKQQLKNYEESVGISHDHGLHVGSASNSEPGVKPAAPAFNQGGNEIATFPPLDGSNDRMKQQSLTMDERKIASKPMAKDFEEVKCSKGSTNSEKQNPEDFAMRISAEVFVINIAKASTENPLRNENSTSRSKCGNASDLYVADDPVLGTRDTSADKTDEGIGMAADGTTADPVDEEIRKVLDSLPKLPEIAFSDNNSQFAFHKDPEEAALDDRITKVARQLVESSVKHQHEEKKLGHYIPIRLWQYDENYPSDSQSKKLGTSKTHANPFGIILEIRQEPQVRLKALPLPQHIYNGPLFNSKDSKLSPSSTEAEQMPQPADTSYATETYPNLKIDTKNGLSQAANTANILHFEPRYVLSTSKNGNGNNRMPIVFHLTPAQPLQAFYNQNDLNEYVQA